MKENNQAGADSRGNGSVHNEHQVQIGLLRALERALQDGDRDGQAAEILEQLKVFTNVHFLSEALLMRLHSYADYDQHCQEHDALLEVLGSVQRSFDSMPAEDRISAVKVFAECITRHITGADENLERFVSQDERPETGG